MSCAFHDAASGKPCTVYNAGPPTQLNSMPVVSQRILGRFYLRHTDKPND